MSHSPRVHAASFQAQVALAAVTGDRTLSEVAAQYQVPVKRVPVWKKPMVEPAATVFAGRVKPVSRKESEAKQAEWFEPIGRLKMEREWLKKSVRVPVSGSVSRSTRATRRCVFGVNASGWGWRVRVCPLSPPRRVTETCHGRGAWIVCIWSVRFLGVGSWP